MTETGEGEKLYTLLKVNHIKTRSPKPGETDQKRHTKMLAVGPWATFFSISFFFFFPPQFFFSKHVFFV